MTQKRAQFLIKALLNALLYSGIVYFMEVKLAPFRFAIQAVIFGVFMGYFQVFGWPKWNRTKKQ